MGTLNQCSCSIVYILTQKERVQKPEEVQQPSEGYSFDHIYIITNIG